MVLLIYCDSKRIKECIAGFTVNTITRDIYIYFFFIRHSSVLSVLVCRYFWIFTYLRINSSPVQLKDNNNNNNDYIKTHINEYRGACDIFLSIDILSFLKFFFF